MKTVLILLITPFLIWSLMRALIVPLLSGRSAATGLVDGELGQCASPLNCKSSSGAEKRPVPPLAFEGAGEADWQQFLDAITSLPGYKLLKRDGDYAHFESRTPLMNYRDDLELKWHRDRDEIAIRSSSRIGIKDLSANTNRIDMIRTLLDVQRR